MKMFYSFVICKTFLSVCGGDINVESHGVISSPGSPGNYPPNRDCIWKLRAPPSKRIQLHFFTLQLEAHETCQYDYLAVSKLYRFWHSLGQLFILINFNINFSKRFIVDRQQAVTWLRSSVTQLTQNHWIVRQMSWLYIFIPMKKIKIWAFKFITLLLREFKVVVAHSLEKVENSVHQFKTELIQRTLNAIISLKCLAKMIRE